MSDRAVQLLANLVTKLVEDAFREGFDAGYSATLLATDKGPNAEIQITFTHVRDAAAKAAFEKSKIRWKL